MRRRGYNPRIDGPRSRPIYMKKAPGQGSVQRGLPPEYRDDAPGAGLGDTLEPEFYYMGYRDPGQGEERPLDVVSKPAAKTTPKQQHGLDAFFERQAREWQRSVQFVKMPANVQPPWFAKPLFKTKCISVSAGATASIFDRVIEARQRAVVTAIGIEVTPLLPLQDCELEFWFSQGGADMGDIIPVFDDQGPFSGSPAVPIAAGKTRVVPGSVENPFCLLSNGLQFRIKGRKDFRFNVENNSAVTVSIRAIMGFYSYWLPWGATEFESADVQL